MDSDDDDGESDIQDSDDGDGELDTTVSDDVAVIEVKDIQGGISLLKDSVGFLDRAFSRINDKYFPIMEDAKGNNVSRSQDDDISMSLDSVVIRPERKVEKPKIVEDNRRTIDNAVRTLLEDDSVDGGSKFARNAEFGKGTI